MLLADILATFVPRGWFPPAAPGTKFVTVGGMIAADVHGKNHHRDGTFGAHVESLTLATADGEIRACSRAQNADLFRATLGGMGLTGVILSASFPLRPIETAFVLEETLAARDLDETMALFEASRDWPYSVAWIDCLARGAKLGRGLLMRGAFMERSALPQRLASDPLGLLPAGKLAVPSDAPSVLLNRVSIGLFNELYYRRGRARAGARQAHFDPFFFPLDWIEAWNRLYGRKGFVQYQCVLPKSESPDGIAALLERVAAAEQGSFLAVLKLFGPAGEGLMSFPMEGYTLALDFPLRKGTLALLKELDEITHRHGGRVYLAKDACCAPQRVREGYPRRSAFDTVRGRGGRSCAQVRLRTFAAARIMRFPLRERNNMTMPKDTTPNDHWRALAAHCLDMTVGVTLSSPLRNALFALFIGGILVYGAGFAWYMLAHFDLVNLLRDVNGDDSFYYFQIARNLAEGKFSTFDGGITQTNGYHPLWLLLITPFYWVFDKEAALFAIKAFEIMLTAGGVALIVLAARLGRLPWILLFALLPMLYRLRALFIGMEAAAALFMLCLLFLALMLYARDPERCQWPLTAVAFVLPWVRLEYVAISLAATGALCFIGWSWQETARLGHHSEGGVRSIPAFKTIVPFLAACAGILVYFTYNRLVFGGIIPVSGAIRQMWSQIRWEREGGYSLARNFQDVLQIHAFNDELLVALEICAYVLLVWWSTRHVRGRNDRLLLTFLVGAFGLAVGHWAKFAQTVLTVDPFWGSYSHYFVPAYLMEALIVPIRCYVAIHLVRRFVEQRLGRVANIPRLGIVTAGAVALFMQADFATRSGTLTGPGSRLGASGRSPATWVLR